MRHFAWPAGFGTSAGLTTGMLVDTDVGWRRAELIKAGESVFTIDGGTRVIRKVDKTAYGGAVAESFPQGLVFVPGGALGYCEAFHLLPDSHILFTGSAVEALTGDGAALVRSEDLVGQRGIGRALPVDGIEAITLAFDEEEVIFANSGVLFHCPPAKAAQRGVSRLFSVLASEEARVLLSCRSLSDEPADEAHDKRIGGHSKSRAVA